MMESPNISSKMTRREDGTSAMHIQVMLDAVFYESLERGEFAGIGERIADKIALELLPEMEQRILSDPQFKDRVIGDILVRIANRLADKGFLEKEPSKEDNAT